MAVLSIQSHVVYGHVGNQAAVLPLQRLGFEVWPVPTVVFSNHPGHGGFRGRPVPAADLAALIDGLEENGWLARCSAVLSGYLGLPDHAAVVADVVERVKAANPAAIYCCDPVLGDSRAGLYVAETVARVMRSRLVPLADMLTPNCFELGWLTGYAIGDVSSALAAAENLRAGRPVTVVGTSVECAAMLPGGIGALAATEQGAWLAATARTEPTLHGLGDLFSALLLGQCLRGQAVPEALSLAVGATVDVLEQSVAKGADELMLVAAQDVLAAPRSLPEAKPLPRG